MNIYIHIYIYTYIYIYIYIERERERIHIYIYIHTHTYIYWPWGDFGANPITGCKLGQGGYGASGSDVLVKGSLTMDENCMGVIEFLIFDPHGLLSDSISVFGAARWMLRSSGSILVAVRILSF